MRNRNCLIACICTLLLFVSSCTNPKKNQHLPDVLTPKDSTLLFLKNDGPYIDFTQFDSVKLNISYADTNNLFQRLDIVYPWNGKAPYKFLMTFHGGGWSEGSRQGRKVVPMQYAATQGYALVNVDYRLSGDAQWPACLYDAKAAVRFLRANAAKYQLDATNIVVIGESAGGYLVEMLGATNGNSAYEYLSMGSPKTSSEVQGIISWFGVSDLTDFISKKEAVNKLMGFNAQLPQNKHKAEKASPIYLVNNSFPPIILVHGTADTIVPYNQSVDMMKKINAVCGEGRATLKTYKGAGHANKQIRGKENLLDNLYFVDKIMYKDGENPYRNTTKRVIRTL